MYIRMIFPLVFLILIPVQSEQTFNYSISDIIGIPFNKSIDISNSLATSTYQNIQQGQIQLTLTGKQTNIQNISFLQYNIIYFNLTNEDGNKCYYEYFNSNQLPNNITFDCTQVQIDDTLGIDCRLFTGCQNQSFQIKVGLAGTFYKQSILMIQNNQQSNVDHEELFLQTNISIVVYNSNIWFYGSVALTCFLLLSLVLLTGIVLYWSLKYKKAKRTLEQMRLTEVDAQTSSIRKSMRKSIMKQQ